MLRRTGQCFLIYSFLGWILEGLFNQMKTGNFDKPNFLHGPVKPMYGFGGVLLAGSYKYDRRHFAYNCWLLPLLVEYISAAWLERQYALKYWDYSKEMLQMDGRICLKFALCWVVLAQVVVRCIQPILDAILRATGKLAGWKPLFQLFFLDCAVTMHQRKKQCALRHYVKNVS